MRVFHFSGLRIPSIAMYAVELDLTASVLVQVAFVVVTRLTTGSSVMVDISDHMCDSQIQSCTAVCSLLENKLLL